MTPDVKEFLTLFLGTGYDDATAVRALAIGYAESGARATIVSRPNTNGTRDYGFLQINSVHFNEPKFREQGWNAQTMLKLGPNIDAGRYLSDGWKNWRPWSTFNSGSYSKHVAQAKRDVAEWHSEKGGTNPVSAISSVAGNAAGALGKLNPLPALIGWLNPLAATIGIATLGMVLLGVGVWLVVGSTKTGQTVVKGAAKVAKAV